MSAVATLPEEITQVSSTSKLAIRAYAGDGDVLLAFSLDEDELKQNKLAGFAIQCTPPTGQPRFLQNRLNFTQSITADTTPQQRVWTSSYDAPFQKFYWVHFPSDIVAGDKGHHIYRYKVIARYWSDSTLIDGPSAEVSVDLGGQPFDNFELGFTRGYLTSQAYATTFHNKDFRQEPKTLDYDTTPFEAQYEWLGYHARTMIYDILKESVDDPSISVDLFAYDFDEVKILEMCEALGPRLRAVLDNSTLHTGTALEVEVHTRLVKSAGMSNIKQGHFKRYAHDKVIIQKKDGVPVKVVTGSANYSVRGLYVQANNVMLFDNPDVAELYERVFDEACDDMSAFSGSDVATQWFPTGTTHFQLPGVPRFAVSFAPHRQASVSLDLVDAALQNAKSSILFAVMELGGSGQVLQTLKNLHTSGKIFSYGVTQSDSGFSVYKPGQPGILVPFAALDKHVPPPFAKEWRGGAGQVIHDKFIVIDFNDANPIVFTGSSNLADGGEQSNGDNLLAIYDPIVAKAFAIEAIRLIDHYHFRASENAATSVHPLTLSSSDAATLWWQQDYDPADIHCVERELFAVGPGAKPSLSSRTIRGVKTDDEVLPHIAATKHRMPGNGGAPPRHHTEKKR